MLFGSLLLIDDCTDRNEHYRGFSVANAVTVQLCTYKQILKCHEFRKIYLDRMSAFTRSVRGFDAATAVSTALPVSSSPSSVMNRIEPIVVYANNNTNTPVNGKMIRFEHFSSLKIKISFHADT